MRRARMQRRLVDGRVFVTAGVLDPRRVRVQTLNMHRIVTFLTGRAIAVFVAVIMPAGGAARSPARGDKPWRPGSSRPRPQGHQR
jgi:hypothetical protein